jgi:2-phospho-L-lactate guanylyltransferase
VDHPLPVAALGSLWALVPLRGLEDAKTRLGAELDPEERLELVTAMAIRTLTAIRDTPAIAGSVLVTADPAAARLAAGLGARTLVQRLPGLNAALREARSMAVGLGAEAVLILPIDLAAISAPAIEGLIEQAAAVAAAEGPGQGLIVAVADRHGSGTNALMIRPPEAIDPAFGDSSFPAHQAAAAAAGAVFERHEGPLTVDIDTVADLLALDAGGRDAA